MKRSQVIKHIKPNKDFFDGFLADESIEPQFRETAKQAIIDGADRKELMKGLLMSADLDNAGPQQLEPANTQKVDPNSWFNTDNLGEGLKGAWGAAGEAGVRMGAPMGAAVIGSRLLGPAGMILGPVLANQAVDMGFRAYRDEPVLGGEQLANDAINRSLDVGTGWLGLKTLGIDSAKVRGLADAGTNFLAETLQRKAMGQPQLDEPAGDTSVDQVLSYIQRLAGPAFGGLMSARGPTQQVDAEAPSNRIEQMLTEIATSKGVQITPEVQLEIRKQANLLNSLATRNPDESLNRNTLGNPYLYPQVAESTNKLLGSMGQTTQDIAGQSMGLDPQGAKKFFEAPESVTDPTLAAISPQARQAAINVGKDVTAPTTLFEGELAPTNQKVGGAIESIDTQKGLLGEQAGEYKQEYANQQADVRAQNFEAGNEARMRELNRYYANLEQLNSKQAGLQQEISQLEAALRDMPEQIEGRNTQALKAKQAQFVENNRLIDQATQAAEAQKLALRNEYADKVEGVKQGTKQQLKDVEAEYQQLMKGIQQDTAKMGAEAQKRATEFADAIRMGKSIVYGEGLNLIDQIGTPVKINPNTLLTRDAASQIMPDAADNIRRKFSNYIDNNGNDPISLTPAELIEIDKRIHSRQGRSDGYQAYDLDKLSQSIDKLIAKNGPTVSGIYKNMKKDYAQTSGYQDDLQNVTAGVTKNPTFGAGEAGNTMLSAFGTNKPMAGVMDTANMAGIKQQAGDLTARTADVEAGRTQAAGDIKTAEAAQLRGLAEWKRAQETAIGQEPKQLGRDMARGQQLDVMAEKKKAAGLKEIDKSKTQLAGLAQKAEAMGPMISKTEAGVDNVYANMLEADRKYAAETDLRTAKASLDERVKVIDDSLKSLKRAADTIQDVPTTDTPSAAKIISEAVSNINQLEKAGHMNPADATEARKALAGFFKGKSVNLPIPDIAKPMAYTDPADVKAAIASNKPLYRLLTTDSQVKKVFDDFFSGSQSAAKSLPVIASLLDMASKTGNQDSIIGWLKSNKTMLNAPESANNWDKLTAAYDQAAVKVDPKTKVKEGVGLNESLGKIINKELSKLDPETGVVDFKTAVKTWDGLPTNMLKNIYGANFPAMDMIMRNLAPILNIADAKMKRTPSSVISHLRSLFSLSGFAKTAISATVGAATGATAGPLVGAMGTGLMLLTLLKAPTILYNQMINKGIKTPASAAASRGALMGDTKEQPDWIKRLGKVLGGTNERK